MKHEAKLKKEMDEAFVKSEEQRKLSNKFFEEYLNKLKKYHNYKISKAKDGDIVGLYDSCKDQIVVIYYKVKKRIDNKLLLKSPVFRDREVKLEDIFTIGTEKDFNEFNREFGEN